MRRVIATDFGIWPSFSQLSTVSDSMLASQDQRAALANYLLLYDQIVIPTGNLQILPVLRLMLGEAAFDELIRTKGIVLVRYDRWFGYAGNGAGLVFFKVTGNPDIPERKQNLGLAYYTPIDEAIDIALSHTNPQCDLSRRAELAKLLIDNVIELPVDKFADPLKDETYKDILGSPYLRSFFALRNAGRSMNHLLGIEANQVRIYDPHQPEPADGFPEILSVLRVAFENFMLSIGAYTEVGEITGDDGTLTVLRAKGQRFGAPIEGRDAFTEIQKVSGIPDIGMAFASGQLSASQLLELRYSKHCEALRDWFSKRSPGDSAEEMVAQFVESLGKPTWIESIPIKMLRFAATTGIGVLEPISGGIVSAVDSFLLSRWAIGKSPRLFLKQAKVMLEKSPVLAHPMMRGRDRNKPCPCGSGKKYKRCCGQ